jgi:hypothetical protein
MCRGGIRTDLSGKRVSRIFEEVFVSEAGRVGVLGTEREVKWSEGKWLTLAR